MQSLTEACRDIPQPCGFLPFDWRNAGGGIKQSGGKTCVGSVCWLHGGGEEGGDSIFAMMSFCLFFLFVLFVHDIRTQQQALLKCFKDLLV